MQKITNVKREVSLCNRAFIATFEKGRWKYSPTFTTTKKPEVKKGYKEPPQYPLLLDIEKTSEDRFKTHVVEMSKEIATFIKNI